VDSGTATTWTPVCLMHVEVLVEDSSGAALVDTLVSRIVGESEGAHTWRVHKYKGVGRLPRGLKAGKNVTHRQLLEQLPRLLQGYGRTPGIDAVVVVVDTDRKDCRIFLKELRDLLATCEPVPRQTMFRLAVEEVEAWYMGDREAVLAAYPKAKLDIMQRYVQDSVCGTWETLADSVYPGGSAKVRKEGWPRPGELKHEWAEKIGPELGLDRNISPSFNKFVEGLRRLLLADEVPPVQTS